MLQPNPYLLSNPDDYCRWRDQKLQQYDRPIDPIVEISNPQTLSAHEHQQITSLCQRYNFAIFSCHTPPVEPKPFVHRLGQAFGLTHLDGNLCADQDNISALQVSSTADDKRQDYIPYSNKPLSWHTDGYYNPPEHTIYGMILYCAQNAASGGSNALLDHEIAYLLLREANPDYIMALMQPNTMTIPANEIEAKAIRPLQTGPVFSVTPQTKLHMRYTARQHSIIWYDNDQTAQARAQLSQILHDNPYCFQATLQPGQGLICNNILHNRSGFQNNAQQHRLIYRARYYDRILKS